MCPQIDFGMTTVLQRHRPEAGNGRTADHTSEQAPNRAHATELGVCGTFLHMAPEVTSSGEYDHKVDVFSFGMVMFQMFQRTSFANYLKRTGFKVTDGHQAMMRGWRPTIARSCPKGISDLIQKCWSQDPQDRPEFSQILEELRMVLATLSSKPSVLRRFVNHLQSFSGGRARSPEGSLTPSEAATVSEDDHKSVPRGLTNSFSLSSSKFFRRSAAVSLTSDHTAAGSSTPRGSACESTASVVSLGVRTQSGTVKGYESEDLKSSMGRQRVRKPVQRGRSFTGVLR